uniref:Syndecan/Neurexin domain-containing protein n=1 Tax=Poecilia formosa TaxID=48698 RepID=A0A096MDJ5_POEFO
WVCVSFSCSSLQHLKMMRLLFLCVLLLLPAATVLSEDLEGSADDYIGSYSKDSDDEDIAKSREIPQVEGSQAENEGTKEGQSQMTLIVIAAVVAVVALSVIAVAAIMLMKRQKLKQMQGIYSVPTEQNEKGTV